MTPTCIGIIMDGNRRWAKKKSLPVLEGHRRGYEKLKETGEWVKEAGVRTLIAYAFSTENWKRSKAEVEYLMDLLRFVLQHELVYFKKRGIKVTVIGDRKLLPVDIQKNIARVESETARSSGLHLVIAISYGGRNEIISACRAIAGDGKNTEEITEKIFSNHLWTAGIPDPDLIIRAGGERRLSNFLPWQSIYSELFFVDTLWPDFSRKEFEKIIAEFGKRERRHGK